MALEKAISKYGFTANNAYHVIDTVKYYKRLITPTVSTGELNGSINVVSYADVDARNDGDEPMEQKMYQFEIETGTDAEDLLTQAYAHLKTLDEFDGATDV